MSILGQFIEANVRLSKSLMPKRFREGQASDRYYVVARELIRTHRPAVIVDVGVGKRWQIGPEIRKEYAFRLIGQDVDGTEMADNPLLDERVVSDASVSLGVPDRSADLVLSHFAIEHIPNNAGFIAACDRALKPGGRVALVFQNRWSPSAILNQLLPRRVTARLLKTLLPGSDGFIGFPAYYDLCSHSQFKRALERQGFVVEYEYNSWYNGNYFAFFTPLFIVSLGIDYLRMALGIRDLSTQNFFVASKPMAPGEAATLAVPGTTVVANARTSHG